MTFNRTVSLRLTSILDTATHDRDERARAYDDHQAATAAHTIDENDGPAETPTILQPTVSSDTDTYETLASSPNPSRVRQGRVRVVNDCVAIGRVVGLSRQDLSVLRQAAMLCDAGKLALSSELVHRPLALLSAQEKAAFRQHPNLAVDVLKRVNVLPGVADIVRAHCEYLDGSGYPNGLKAPSIPVAARIINVVKTYADLRSGKRSAKSSSQIEARDYLSIHAGPRLDKDIVEQFCYWLNDTARGTGEHVERLVGLGDLRPGMRLSRDIRDDYGLLMLAGGVKITSRLITRLKTLTRIHSKPLSLYVADCCT